jgi:uncharacterized protein
MSKYFQINILDSIQKVSKSDWDQLSHDTPFTSYDFLLALEQSGATSLDRGWKPIITLLQDSKQVLQMAMLGHLKSHSYGEYIFDWNIAEAYQQAREQYYPKYCSSIPFTPVNASKILIRRGGQQELSLSEFIKHFETQISMNSYHHLFITAEIQKNLIDCDYIPRLSVQYHWINQDYKSFEDFLLECHSSKRKMMKKERRKVSQYDIEIISIKPEEMASYSNTVFKFYLETINKKGAIAYLNETFFEMILRSLKHSLVLEIAFLNGQPIAFSLFFKTNQALYGRYWGVDDEQEENYPFLHFEMCYYRGIDFCIMNKLPLFEAGAQGIHKISRGFRPTRIHSSHKFSNLKWHQLVEKYMQEERNEVLKIIQEQSKLLPFHLGGNP